MAAARASLGSAGSPRHALRPTPPPPAPTPWTLLHSHLLASPLPSSPPLCPPAPTPLPLLSSPPTPWTLPFPLPFCPQLWDLRNSVSPIREFHGHAKGVLAMSWCPQDSSFLLSSGKDNRTICWDVGAGESAGEGREGGAARGGLAGGREGGREGGTARGGLAGGSEGQLEVDRKEGGRGRFQETCARFRGWLCSQRQPAAALAVLRY